MSPFAALAPLHHSDTPLLPYNPAFIERQVLSRALGVASVSETLADAAGIDRSIMGKIGRGSGTSRRSLDPHPGPAGTVFL